jgi:hypothetical protein
MKKYQLELKAPKVPYDLLRFNIVVNDNMIQHNILSTIRGTLIRSHKSGQYRLFCADDGKTYACGINFAKEYDNTLRPQAE